MNKIAILILLLQPFCVLGQSTIKGKLFHNKKEVSGICVLAHPAGNKNALLAFAISQLDGSFQLQLKTSLDSLCITTSSVNYADTSLFICNKNQTINLDLKSEIHDLKEVLVKADPIFRKKDTIVYNVGSFAKANDRSIGDVINKLPGFEVERNGSISYQGKKIEKYYIEGLDLLEGRYGIANRNLSHKAVRTVEVLENHQPIKLLDTLVFSDKTSINIRLKKKLSVAGKAKLGIGAKPLLWDANLTPMFFNKKQQAIVSYQSNNIGDDIAEQLLPHYFSEMKNEPKEELLGIIALSPPAIAKNRYLDNNIHLLTYNHILKLNQDASLKINTSYVNDYQQQQGAIQNNYYLPADTISTYEVTKNNLSLNRFNSDLIYTNNSKQRYIKDKLSWSKHWDKSRGNVQNENSAIQQFAKTPFNALNNHLKWILPINRNLVTIKSDVSYNKTPQSLDIKPGVFQETLNGSENYDDVQQHITLQNFTSKNSLSFTLNKKSWSFDNEIGIEYQNKQLLSFMEINNKKKEENQFRNNLRWKYFSSYFTENFRYETPNLNISLEIPIRQVNYKINDHALQKTEALSKIILNPGFYLNYKISGYFTSDVSASYINTFGSSTDIHYGYLMSNYRSLSIRDIPIEERENCSYSTQIKYTNPISCWFASIHFNQTYTTQNILLDQSITPDGSSKISASLQDNNSQRSLLFFKGSKLFSEFGTTIFFNARYQYTQSSLLSNAVLTKVKNDFYLLEPRLSISKFTWMSFDYKYQYSQNQQHISGSISKFINNNHLFNLDIFPVSGHSIGLELEYYSSKSDYSNNKTNFANIKYTWKPKHTKMIFELKCYNLFDDKRITSYYSNSIASIENSYRIRPRQIMISLDFPLQ
ncbi:hypothetical protein [Ancylomarina longa]|uniref:hypothetical protein n=1 Tax=Ancylomarina longa TaxID=2487017 RepID=UPI000FCBC6CE|nr:hypothetical protein [Ancylomarina longa]